MAEAILAEFLDVAQVLRPAFTAASFMNVLVVMVGWVLMHDRHAITGALVATDVAGRRHHAAFHRLFSRARWEPDEVGRRLLLWLVSHASHGATIRLAVDDTITPKKGPDVWGLGTHLDPVHSTRRHRIFCFGHCWVVLALLVHVPFSSRTWALPILFRLYRNKKACRRKDRPYRKKTELARELLLLVGSWLGSRRIEISSDSGYCNGTVVDGLPDNFVVIGRMRLDAVLTAAPGKVRGARGRPRRRGQPIPKPERIARDGRRPWQTAKAHLYGKDTTVRFKTICAQWYRVCGQRLLRIVIVQVSTGTVPFQVFFSTDPNLSPVDILQGYSKRWSLECTFFDLKQWFGFADSSARSQRAVERTAPFVGLTFTALVLWFGQSAWTAAVIPNRPWYRHKKNISFADILRTAQAALQPYAAFLASTCGEDNLHETPCALPGSAAHRAQPAQPRAA
jgi:hypothetical protein